MDALAGAGTGTSYGLFSAFCCFGYLVPIVVALALLVLWVVALVDVLQRQENQFPGVASGNPNPNERLIWVLVVLLLNGLGALVYYFMVMRPLPRVPRR